MPSSSRIYSPVTLSFFFATKKNQETGYVALNYWRFNLCKEIKIRLKRIKEEDRTRSDTNMVLYEEQILIKGKIASILIISSCTICFTTKYRMKTPFKYYGGYFDTKCNKRNEL